MHNISVLYQPILLFIIYNYYIFQCFISIDVVYLIVHANLPSSNVNLKLIFKPIIYFNNVINNIL